MNRLFFAIVAFAGFGCATLNRVDSSPPMMKVFDRAIMDVEIRKFISEGMPIEEAKQIMEKNGFSCQDVNFNDYEKPHIGCETSCPRPWRWCLNDLIMSDKINVELFYERGVVIEIYTWCYTLGP
jgi:hypothetical protein